MLPLNSLGVRDNVTKSPFKVWLAQALTPSLKGACHPPPPKTTHAPSSTVIPLPRASPLNPLPSFHVKKVAIVCAVC